MQDGKTGPVPLLSEIPIYTQMCTYTYAQTHMNHMHKHIYINAAIPIAKACVCIVALKPVAVTAYMMWALSKFTFGLARLSVVSFYKIIGLIGRYLNQVR